MKDFYADLLKKFRISFKSGGETKLRQFKQ